MSGRAVAVALLAAVLAGCGLTIVELNERPDKYYQHKVTFRGRIARIQRLEHETLLEVADSNGHRVLVRTTAPVDVDVDTWVRVRGLLVPEARVDDRVLHDLVVAEDIRRARRPLLAGIT